MANVQSAVLEIVLKTKGGAKFKEDFAALGSVLGAVAAAGLAMKKAFEFAEEGAQLLRLADSGEALAESMGSSMDRIVESVKAASFNTVADLDIIQGANRAMLLGLGADAGQMARLMEVAAFRARAMGLSTTQAFNDIVTGVGRMSPMILDNLGLVIDKNTIFTEGMTEAEKKQALLNAVLREGSQQIKAVGGFTADAASNYERFHAAIKDSQDAFKMFLAGEGNAYADWLANAAQGLSLLIKAQLGLSDDTQYFISDLGGLAMALGEYAGGIERSRNEAERMKPALDAWAERNTGLANSMSMSQEATDAYSMRMTGIANAMRTAGLNAGFLVTGVRNLATALDTFTPEQTAIMNAIAGGMGAIPFFDVEASVAAASLLEPSTRAKPMENELRDIID